jgi:hypothetical protein
MCLSSRPVRFVNAVPTVNRDHGPGMPAAREDRPAAAVPAQDQLDFIGRTGQVG